MKMAETFGNFQLIDEDILAECVSSAIHQNKKEEKRTLLRQEQGTQRSTKEREPPVNDNLRNNEKKGSELWDSKTIVNKNPETIDTKATVRKKLLGRQDPSCFSKSHFSLYSKRRREISAVYKPNLKQNEKCLRMMPYSVPLYRKSNGRSYDSRRRFEVGSRTTLSLCPVSDHDLSNPASIYSHSKKSANNCDIDMHGRFRKDDMQELIFKIYSEQQQTLEELLRCKTQSCYRPCDPPSCPSIDVLDQSLPTAPALAPHRFLMKKHGFNTTDNADMCLKIPDLLKVGEDGEYKEELFDAFHVPYFKEKQGIAKQLDELFSITWNDRINFV